jgi:hypothetical protein
MQELVGSLAKCCAVEQVNARVIKAVSEDLCEKSRSSPRKPDKYEMNIIQPKN